MSRIDVEAGRKPTLSWLPVDALSVDSTYQRSLEGRRSQEMIEKIANDFKWYAFQAILATEKAPGNWLILDGQHRVEAARRCGIAHVPAVIVETGSVADQAAAFVRTNLDRVAITPYALFHARIAAGDEQAIRIAAVCNASGITIPAYPIQAERMQPGQTLALEAVKRWVATMGDHASIRVLSAIAETWREPAGQIRANILLAIRDIAATDQASPEMVAKLKRVLAATSANTLEAKARARRERYGGSFKDNMAALLKQAISLQGSRTAGPSMSRLMAGR